MPRLESHDELGVPWEEFADGRVHRLVKGRDFVRGAELVEEAAGNAAVRLERVVRTYREIRWGMVYLWVQFVDHEIVIGEPCFCGGQLLQVNQNFAECSSCKATVALLKPSREREEAEVVTEDEPLLLGLLAAPVAAQRNGRRARAGRGAPPSDPRKDLTRLGAYSQITLYGHLSDERRVRLYGHGLGSAGETCLMVVDYPLENGGPVEDPSFPGRRRHAVWSMPAGPFGSLVRLEELDGRGPVLRIDDPLRDWSPAPSPAAPLLDAAQPPNKLGSLVDVTLFPFSSSRSCGHARTSDGELVILIVRYRGSLPEGPEEGSPVRCVPVAPFGSVVDVDALLAKEAGSPIIDGEPVTTPALEDESGEEGPRQMRSGRRRLRRARAQGEPSTDNAEERTVDSGEGTKRERRGRRRKGEAEETIERPSA